MPFYGTATHITHPSAKGITEHELAHGQWAFDSAYRTGAQSLLRSHNLTGLFVALKLRGYCDEVLEDEAHAQAVFAHPSSRVHIPAELSRDMRSLFLSSFPVDHLRIYTEGLRDEEWVV